MKLPSFRHFEDRFLTTNKDREVGKNGLCFARFVFVTFRRPFALHDSNPYPLRSRIAQYKTTKSPTSPKESPKQSPKKKRQHLFRGMIDQAKLLSTFLPAASHPLSHSPKSFSTCHHSTCLQLVAGTVPLGTKHYLIDLLQI